MNNKSGNHNTYNQVRININKKVYRNEPALSVIV
jgi:hypothetical protein